MEQTKRPVSSAFRQQRLSAWQPILTASTVLPTFFLIGLAFIPIGIGLFLSSEGVREIQVDYTACLDKKTNKTCREVLETNWTTPPDCVCEVPFTIEDNYLAHVFVYYGLTNFYQNHRRYVKSREDKQLLGNPLVTSLDCDPFSTRKDKDGVDRTIAPCGAIANSLFNDTIKISRNIATPGSEPEWKLIDILRTDIAWPTDRNVKFRNPKDDNYNGTISPPAWSKSIKEMGGFTNEDLIVWMRTAALPTFRKLYGRVDHDNGDADIKYHLPKGQYQARIDYNYPVGKFKGTKRVILSNTSWLGGKNPFLGIAYMTVGSICLVLGAVFLFIHYKFGKNYKRIRRQSARTCLTVMVDSPSSDIDHLRKSATCQTIRL